ncbi:MAG: cupin [Thiomonas sp.]
MTLISGAESVRPDTLNVEPPASTYHVGAVDAAHFSSLRMGALRHDFDRHPLMQLPRLAQLAHDLMPSKQCRFIRPGTTQTSAFTHSSATPDGRDIDAVFAHIEEPGSWVALYDVQTDPQYAAFLDEVVASAHNLISREQPGLFRVAGFIFISAPPSVTPFHIDRENNLWLQIRGRKQMTVFDHRDRDVVAAREVENFIVDGSLGKVQLDEGLRPRGVDFDVATGDGVYFPATSPHMTRTTTDWVRPGDGVSISIGVVFYTAVTRHHARVHQCNRVLRNLGLDPVVPGLSPWRDAVIAPLGYAIAAARARWRGYSPPPGSY